MRADEYASVMQDQFFTIRAERYVLPLKASAKSLGLGIVHDTSRTGETVFVEPTALVAANNRLKVVELDIRRESRRILEALTADVAAVAPALRRTAAALAALDARAAAARLGRRRTAATRSRSSTTPVVDLRAARHPLLALAHAASPRTSSPTTSPSGGGRAADPGRERPERRRQDRAHEDGRARGADGARGAAGGGRAPGSRVGFFDAVRADIGDRQSVLGDLSTFSGHLANVGDILNAPTSAAGPTLVLLDELMAGTNPEQGAALARATAETLADAAGARGHHHPLRQPEGARRERRAVRERRAWSTTSSTCGRRSGSRWARPGDRTRSTSPRAWACPAPLLERARELAGGVQPRARVGDRAARGARGGARSGGGAARRGGGRGERRPPRRSGRRPTRSPGASASSGATRGRRSRRRSRRRARPSPPSSARPRRPGPRAPPRPGARSWPAWPPRRSRSCPRPRRPRVRPRRPSRRACACSSSGSAPRGCVVAAARRARPRQGHRGQDDRRGRRRGAARGRQPPRAGAARAAAAVARERGRRRPTSRSRSSPRRRAHRRPARPDRRRGARRRRGRPRSRRALAATPTSSSSTATARAPCASACAPTSTSLPTSPAGPPARRARAATASASSSCGRQLGPLRGDEPPRR